MSRAPTVRGRRIKYLYDLDDGFQAVQGQLLLKKPDGTVLTPLTAIFQSRVIEDGLPTPRANTVDGRHCFCCVNLDPEFSEPNEQKVFLPLRPGDPLFKQQIVQVREFSNVRIRYYQGETDTRIRQFI